jgi:hypothetical protein
MAPRSLRSITAGVLSCDAAYPRRFIDALTGSRSGCGHAIVE